MKSSIIALTLGILVNSGAVAQQRGATPIPEFFGIYAVAKGNLIELTGGLAAATPKVRVRFGTPANVEAVFKGSPLASISEAEVLLLTKDARFIVNLQSGSGDVAANLQITPMVFIANITIDTGPYRYPTVLRRTGPVHAWEAPHTSFFGMISETLRQPIRVRTKPVAGQQSMVMAVPAQELSGGLYALSGGEYWKERILFAVEPLSQGETQKRIDELCTWSMLTAQLGCEIKTHVERSVAGAPSTAPIEDSGGIPTSKAASTGPPSCGDYASCLSSGWRASKARDWAGAIAGFQGATVTAPSRKDGWENLALALLMSGRAVEEVSKPWDTLLQSGRVVSVAACRAKLFSCEVGSLSLSKTKIVFNDSKGKEGFAIAPSQVTPGELKKRSVLGTNFTSFRLNVAGKDQWFDFIPWNGEKCVHGANYFCEGDAAHQQEIVGEYVLASVKSLGDSSRHLP
jgi:hypothetical protein